MKNFRQWIPTLVVALAALTALGIAKCASAQELIVATGNLQTGTYSKMFTEITRYCQPSTIGIMIKQQQTTGSVENLSLLLDNKVNGAWVQSDMLFLRKAQDKSKTEPIKTLVGLHPEELHFVARADTKTEGGVSLGKFNVGGSKVTFNTLGDLRGRAVGAVGGSFVSLQLVSQNAGLDLQPVEFPNNDALKAALLGGQIDAALIVGGAPHPVVASLTKQFRLLPVGQDTAMKLKDVYDPILVSYDNLGQASVPTLATQALFVSRLYSSEKMNATLGKLRKCIKDNIPELKDALGTHPKWQAVTVENDGKWPLYPVK